MQGTPTLSALGSQMRLLSTAGSSRLAAEAQRGVSQKETLQSFRGDRRTLRKRTREWGAEIGDCRVFLADEIARSTLALDQVDDVTNRCEARCLLLANL